MIIGFQRDNITMGVQLIPKELNTQTIHKLKLVNMKIPQTYNKICFPTIIRQKQPIPFLLCISLVDQCASDKPLVHKWGIWKIYVIQLKKNRRILENFDNLIESLKLRDENQNKLDKQITTDNHGYIQRQASYH